jgi:hypothetical protein
MATAAEGAPETIATPAPAKVKQGVFRPKTAIERAEILLAKKKKKRAAHRVALRRSHTNG